MVILRTFIEQHPSDRWDEILPQRLLAYRVIVHSITEYAPPLLTLGHGLSQTAEVLTSLVTAEYIRLPHHVNGLRKWLRIAYKIVTPHQSKWRHHQKSCYDGTTKGPVYRTGDHV
ncbi:uncharacterized protein DEA37_0005563 [Paragonimus westermani]|uniref:Uncharacterized protein n=1 Tax=Paragonimus westermani TaxID=34504 RepID=A0A5J4N882_9TREM|nr:uncharacterized protein DEA37_0005563 [Paragonimus westermani]